MYGITNAGGGSGTKSTLIISTDSGSTVQVYANSTYTTLVKTATEKSAGRFWVKGLDNGTYYLRATLGTKQTQKPYTISEYGVYRIPLLYRTVPAFTYVGGTYEVVEDDDTVISDITTYNGTNWKIRFLTSGTLSFTELCGAADGIDVFLVGGGGGGGAGVGNGGGGGGYTATHSSVSVATGTSYSIAIGDGGSYNADGGSSSAFTYSVNGGKTRAQNAIGYGGEGGSGGGAGTNVGTTTALPFRGGSDGSAGYDNGNLITTLGKGLGQGTTTREFGEAGATLYAGGGGAGINGGSSNQHVQEGGDGGGGSGADATHTATNGVVNTGGGGGGGVYNNVNNHGGSGGSGIVIIRNARS